MKEIYIKNQEELNKKINQIKQDGLNSLHIVSDWDRTLTKSFYKNKRTQTTFGQLREGGYLGEDYVKQAFDLHAKYYPIEKSKEIPKQEKLKKMKEWWETHLQLLIDKGMDKSVINELIQKKSIIARRGISEFMNILHQHNIQLLIFSAGLGDIIQEFLKSEKILFPNMHIISNFYKFDSNGKAVGYKNDIIHVFNKDEAHIKNNPYYNQIKQRTNVILIGDSVEDCDMIKGLNHKTTIKIGFLSENIEENLDSFKKEYDIIILDDGPMDYINDLIKNIVTK